MQYNAEAGADKGMEKAASSMGKSMESERQQDTASYWLFRFCDLLVSRE